MEAEVEEDDYAGEKKEVEPVEEELGAEDGEVVDWGRMWRRLRHREGAAVSYSDTGLRGQGEGGTDCSTQCGH